MNAIRAKNTVHGKSLPSVLTVLALVGLVMGPGSPRGVQSVWAAEVTGSGASCELPLSFEPNGKDMSDMPLESAKENNRKTVRPPLDLAVPEAIRTATFALG